jgi:serine protease Do
MKVATTSMVVFLILGSLFASCCVAQSADQLKAMMLTSKAFRSATKRIEPSLVSIESFGGSSAKQGRIGGIRKQGEGNTTGVIISSDGYILTSTFNFIRQAPVVTVETADGQNRVAKILGRDDTRKVCLLKIDDVSDLPVPEMLPTDQVAVGQWAVSVGVGYGDRSPALSMGIISAKNRIGGRAIQTDANISPANYGGPLVDIEGRMIGICVPMNPQSQAVAAGVEWYDSGIGFAVPVTDFRKIIDRLKDGTNVRPAFVGLALESNPKGDGMVVKQVVKGSAAEQAKLMVGDVLLELAGQQVNDMLRLRQVLNRFEAGQKVKLVYLPLGKRELAVEAEAAKGKPVSVEVVLGEPPRPKGAMESQLEPPKIR